MLNYIFLYLLEWLLTISPSNSPGQSNAISKTMPTTAQMPHLFGSTLRVNLSLIVALAMALVVWWLMQRSRLGFSFKVIGLNPDAGKTAGMDARLHHRPRAHDLRSANRHGRHGRRFGHRLLALHGLRRQHRFQRHHGGVLGPQQPRWHRPRLVLFAALISGGRDMQRQ